MTSVNYNAAATSALRTLQNTNSSLDATQNRISTGLKIGEAKDNAAYWSISTTMKSDNKSLSTVKDALGLGAATVDVAYQAMNSTLDVLDQIKTKLVAATQDGVDKKAIQSEISELQKQLSSIANSAAFSGENWLSVNSSSSAYSAVKEIVSSYTRSATGAVSIGTISVDTSAMVLIDAKTGTEGILDGGVSGNTNTGGIAAGTSPSSGTGSATSGTYVTGAVTNPGTGVVAADGFTAVFKIDGVTKTFSSLFTGETFSGTSTLAEYGAAVKNRLLADANFAALADVSFTTDKFTFTSDTKGASSTIELVSLSYTDTSASTTTANTIATSTKTDGVNAKFTAGTDFATANALTLDANDTFSFDVTIDSGAATRVTITKTLVDSVLGKSDGKIASTSDYKLVLGEALKNAGLQNVVVGDDTDSITLQAGKASIAVSNVNASQGTNLLTFNITNATSEELSSLTEAVNAASKQVTSAAATLGGISARIDLQKTFVGTLMDTIEKGISGLVDADMNEESTKLQALQVKQQLGVQALSIANQSAQNVLSLFRS
ncbi:flagellin [Aureimonas jatrophae]|uniref:Flagellin n=1 Tax=Aureimonas jatrophae TaxID=1166073 RepID=A0A1H0L221_9HYPH|nr:flagellin [Aureimonas jatrophae]MBB3952372.1 flagellin [Aureimonas jatrophae]SDO62030.1 flagellin [Aureimonas jatrophae]